MGGGGGGVGGVATVKSALCVGKAGGKKGATNTSKVKSVVGMYIRGEKKIEEIVHPSKISRKLCGSGTPRPPSSFRCSSAGVNALANLAKFVYHSMENVRGTEGVTSEPEVVEPAEPSTSKETPSAISLILSSSCSTGGEAAGLPVAAVATGSSPRILFPSGLPVDDALVEARSGSADAPQPLKIASVDRINFEGDDMVIKLNSESPPPKREPTPWGHSSSLSSPPPPSVAAAPLSSNVDCSIRPSRRRDRKLDLVIAPSSQHVVSQMVLENKRLKLQVKPIEETRPLASAQPQLRQMVGGCQVRNAHQLAVCGRGTGVADKADCAPDSLQLALRSACDVAKMAADSMSFSNSCLLTTTSTAVDPALRPRMRDKAFAVEGGGVDEFCRRHSGISGLFADSAASSFSAGSSSALDVSAAVDDADDLAFVLPDVELKPLKTDVYYYREKIAHEQKQIDDLRKEISKAERLFKEYEEEKLKMRDEDSLCSGREDFERLLREFSAVSDGRSAVATAAAAANGTQDAGLNSLIGDYCTKYYDSLAKKIDQFGRERSALQVVIDNLTKEQSELEEHVSHFEQKLAQKS